MVIPADIIPLLADDGRTLFLLRRAERRGARAARDGDPDRLRDSSIDHYAIAGRLLRAVVIGARGDHEKSLLDRLLDLASGFMGSAAALNHLALEAATRKDIA